MPPKKAKEPEPEPEPELEHEDEEKEPEGPTPEEIEYENNIGRIKFVAAVPKIVCSPHSGSILAKDGPCVPLSDELFDKARKVFDSGLEEDVTTIDRTNLPMLLRDCGFVYGSEDDLAKRVEPLLMDMLAEDGAIDSDFFCRFVEVFQNPPCVCRNRVYCRVAPNKCFCTLPAVLVPLGNSD